MATRKLKAPTFYIILINCRGQENYVSSLVTTLLEAFYGGHKHKGGGTRCPIKLYILDTMSHKIISIQCVKIVWRNCNLVLVGGGWVLVEDNKKFLSHDFFNNHIFYPKLKIGAFNPFLGR